MATLTEAEEDNLKLILKYCLNNIQGSVCFSQNCVRQNITNSYSVSDSEGVPEKISNVKSEYCTL